MLVHELIEKTEWHSPREDSAPPVVTVILPTFRRGRCGLFKKAAESVLNQLDCSLELLIVDDCSTDGTLNQIEDLYKTDPRVGYLRHQHNIGLPAISEYEAYKHARGTYIAFAFDDTAFRRNGIRDLMAAIESQNVSCVYGEIETFLGNSIKGIQRTRRVGSFSEKNNLLAANFIPNNGVLLHRNVLEQVGLYDPSPIIARLCDWDLWCRVRACYEMGTISSVVGEEHGPARSDSLGRSYSMEEWAIAEWMTLNRNEALKPKTFEELDVLDIPARLSREVASMLTTLNENYLNKWTTSGLIKNPKTFYSKEQPLSDYRADKCRILVCSKQSPQLNYQTFIAGKKSDLYFLRITSPRISRPIELVRSSVLILTEPDSKKLSTWIATARLLDIPIFGLSTKDSKSTAGDDESDVVDYRLELLYDKQTNPEEISFPVGKDSLRKKESAPWATMTGVVDEQRIHQMQQSALELISKRYPAPTLLETDRRWRILARTPTNSRVKRLLKKIEKVFIKPFTERLKRFYNHCKRSQSCL